MQKKKMIQLGVFALMTGVVLAGCGSKIEVQKEESVKTSTTQKEQDKKKEIKKEENSDKMEAEKAAGTVLDFVFKGKSSGLNNVIGISGTDMTRIAEDTIYDSKIKDYPGNGWSFQIDGSIYTAEDIFRQYSKVYVKGFKQIDHYQITDVDVKGDTATVKVKLDPIAMNSVANAITWTRANVYGSLDASKMIGESQNTDIKAINNLLTFKIYDIIYGDKGVPMELYGEDIEVELTLEKDGDKFKTDTDAVLDIMKQAQINEYSKTESKESQEKLLDDKMDGTEL
ncbi:MULTISPECIES: hypothetical protein [Carnobacterium]|uniref:hypothetical protein n=1 Tax=Carnobacterium TaxID=2747 RepID=UPI0010717F74|nr:MULTISPECIES: hypothetical protein [Carnobacterium]MDT1939382.1 hypothetical protein [Carnobacterium divergens]MDT1941820.1 hypothetical protein [Carnobacterium divergens]MDT1947618.1 hypothetical protein [Carnobacterium divergens]MDT1950105.1 hypothetical protein [Carnobacterium divergens]MDT1955283.1 hypothetical protein [Carnobacterium divergens]